MSLQTIFGELFGTLDYVRAMAEVHEAKLDTPADWLRVARESLAYEVGSLDWAGHSLEDYASILTLISDLKRLVATLETLAQPIDVAQAA